MMPANWSKYCEQLREVDDSLYNQKEKFKMGLMSSPSPLTTKVETLEVTDGDKESAKEVAEEEQLDDHDSLTEPSATPE